MTEAEQLDDLTLENAKAILHQLGFFADVTCFLSLRLTPDQIMNLQAAAVTSPLSMEQLLSRLCRQFTLEQQLSFNSFPPSESRR